MSEFLGDDDRNPFQELAEGAATPHLRRRAFYAQRLAHTILTNEMGVHADGDVSAVLTEILGICVENGIVLGIRQMTNPETIENRAQELVQQLAEIHPDLSISFEPYVAGFVERGILFHEELEQDSARVQAWRTEFQLLESTGLTE